MVTPFNSRAAAVLAGIAASFAFAVPPVAAQQPAIVIQSTPQPYLRVARVPYWDLNLATPDGEQSLHRRVGRAVENVCLYDPGRWYGLSEPDYNYCKSGAWQRARPQMFGAVYRARLLAHGRGY
jgi:UrcA family protein